MANLNRHERVHVHARECMKMHNYKHRLLLLLLLLFFFSFLPEVRVIPQDLKNRDNFFVLGWLVFDDVSAKSAMKSKCVEMLDGNR